MEILRTLKSAAVMLGMSALYLCGQGAAAHVAREHALRIAVAELPADPPITPLRPPPPVAPQPQKRDPKPSAPVPPGAKESTRPEVKPASAESRSPLEATLRAADPKDPSGALIIAPGAR